MWKSYKVNEQIRITEMYTMFCAHREYNYSFLGEYHNFWECVYVVDGTIRASANKTVYVLNKNEIIFHKPLEIHKLDVLSETGATIFIFTFSMDGIGVDFFNNKVFKLNDIQKKYIEDFLYFLKENNNSPDPQDKESTLFLRKFEYSTTYSQLCVTYIYQLFLSLMAEHTILSVSETPEASIFSKAVNYMNSHITTQIYISDIANYCNISTTGLKRIFYKFSGMGIHKYFIKLKINTAAQLLTDGESVTQIAEYLGFSSQGYFSLVFKRETGLTPTEFKLSN